MIKSNIIDEGLNALVDSFALAMKAKFQEKYKAGYHGWDNDFAFNDYYEKIIENTKNGDWIDVANMAAILWNWEMDSKKMFNNFGGNWIKFKDAFPEDGEMIQILLEGNIITNVIKFDEIETMLNPKFSGAFAWKKSKILNTEKCKKK